MNSYGKSSSNKWLIISLLICLISMVFSSAFQNCFGKVETSELRLVDRSGYEVSSLLYKPDSATVYDPAPCIITIEGWFNNKEMQDLYSVEYARRGYVVIAVDMHGHGDSESTNSNFLYSSAVGVDAAVELAGTLPFVDQSKIALTGHSSGGAAADMAMAIDNERAVPLISAVFYEASTWVDDTGVDHMDDFNGRSAGIIADKYDEFFFWTTDESGNDVGPREFLNSWEAKRFVSSGSFDYVTGNSSVEPGKYYGNPNSLRVIYQPSMTHPWVHFSSKSVGYGIEFFEKVFGAPNPISPRNQIWQFKVLFNFIGLLGVIFFSLAFMSRMLETSYFGVLKAKNGVKPLKIYKTSDYLWFLVPLILCSAFSPLCFYFCIDKVYGITTKYFTQNGPLLMGLWSLISGLFCLILLIIYYYAYGKKNGFSLTQKGVQISGTKLCRTIVLALLTTSLMFLILFFADFFFKTDFRIWVLTLKAFGPDKVVLGLKYLPFFLVFYIINSIAVNSFNYNNIGGEKGNTFLLATANVLGLIVFELIQYITFISTGLLKWYSTEGYRISGIWLFPAIIYLFITPFLTRFIYKKTNNPYLSGIVNAIIITMMCVANTTTILGGAAVVASNY